jgi:hypothetical protein
MTALKAICAFGVCGLLLTLIACGGGGSSGMPTPTPTPVAGVTVSPSSATVALGAAQGFTAAGPTGAPVTVNWSQNPAIGTLQPNGSTVMFVAPSNFPSPNTVTITATLQSDSTKSSSAMLTVVYPNNTHQGEATPVKLGTSGGNSTDSNTVGTKTTCCSGTLGSLVTRGGNFFILSNNHVLDKSDRGGTGDPIGQPGLIDNNCSPGTVVANLTQFPAVKPANGTDGPAPSNVDAAIAQIVSGTVDTSGAILDLGAAGPSSIAAAPPSATLAVPATVLGTNEGVAKVGRSTGLTCSTLQAINVTVSVDYNAVCGGAKAFTSMFTNQVIVNGGNFSAAGDSGSLIVTSDKAQPVALLYGGNSTTSSGNPISEVLNVFKSGVNSATMVGGADHAVSCVPTASSSAGPSASAAGTLSPQESQRVAGVRQRRAAQLMEDPAVTAVSIGASADNPGEGAVVIRLSGSPRSAIPQALDGVRTRIVRAQPEGAQMPVLNVGDLDYAASVKENHAGALMSQSGIQGIGVGRSDDNPQETAIVIYVLSGVSHPQIPATFEGVRTKIVEGDRFRAFGWGKETRPAVKCVKP